MKVVRFDSEAEADLREAIVRYERERTGLGDELWSDVQEVLHRIEEYPEIGDARSSPRRRAPHSSEALPILRNRSRTSRRSRDHRRCPPESTSGVLAISRRLTPTVRLNGTAELALDAAARSFERRHPTSFRTEHRPETAALAARSAETPRSRQQTVGGVHSRRFVSRALSR